MIPTKTSTYLQSWSTVGWWTALGTLVCVAISILFNALFFDDLGGEALQRSIISATILPFLFGLPIIGLMSLRMRDLAVTNSRLGEFASTDSLTRCLNRGAFTAGVTQMLTREQEGTDGALLMIDADNFKALNDLYGHESGDEALRIIVRSIRAVLRPGDLLGRVGGEEFAVYLPGADRRTTESVAERIRRSVNLAAFAPDGRQRRLSVSIGGAVFEGATGLADLLRIADHRLYDAKRTGRNRVAVVHVDDQENIELRRCA